MSPIAQNPVAGSPRPTTALSDEVIEKLRGVPILASLKAEEFHCLDGASDIHLAPGEWLVHENDPVRCFWMLLEGSLRIIKDGHGSLQHPGLVLGPGQAFGEVPLLANLPAVIGVEAIEQSRLLQLDEDQFWRLMTSCPGVRKAILGNMADRMQKMQSVELQQEKMAALGVMAAGLMHELNNPGTAASRAASQLRENLMRMHHLAARFTKLDLNRDQKHCILQLQTHVLDSHPSVVMNSLEQSDAEERLAEWLDRAQVDRAWQIAPTLVAAGIDAPELECARGYFSGQIFSDALGWIEAMVSSQQAIGIIEESIGRVSDLVHAVKSYAYEGKGMRQKIDLNESIHATVVILAHKMREKQIVVEKNFARDLPPLESECSGLNQIWTNLLDNAIDAVPQGGHIAIKTWSETTGNGKPRVDLCVSVRDNGSGIPLESQPHIFDPFYTTKAVGVGTGLGLGIVYRIVEQYGGHIHFTSEPGNTEFFVRIPALRA